MQRTKGNARQQILYLLKTKGAMSVESLSSHLGITQVAVRQHLMRLRSNRLADYQEPRFKVGRPARIWSLTSRGSDEFPDTHGDLTVELLRCVRNIFGASGLSKLIDAHRRETTAKYRSCMEPESSTEERLAALAEQRTADGFMAEWGADGKSCYFFVENHCSISAAARVCDGFCSSELEMFQDILGDDVKVHRISHLLAGADRCRYRITLVKDQENPRPPAPARKRRRPRHAPSP